MIVDVLPGECRHIPDLAAAIRWRRWTLFIRARAYCHCRCRRAAALDQEERLRVGPQGEDEQGPVDQFALGLFITIERLSEQRRSRSMPLRLVCRAVNSFDKSRICRSRCAGVAAGTGASGKPSTRPRTPRRPDRRAPSRSATKVPSESDWNSFSRTRAGEYHLWIEATTSGRPLAVQR